MEVGTTERRPGPAEEFIPSLPPQPAQAPSHLYRIAETAARALGVAHVCVYIADSNGVGETCTGPGSDIVAPLCRTFMEDGLFSDGRFNDGNVIQSGGSSPRDDEFATAGSYVAARITASEELYCVLCVYDLNDRRFREEEVDLVHQFAVLASSELQRQSEVRLLRKRETRFGAGSGSPLDVVAILDSSGRITHISPSSLTVFHSVPSQLIGTSIYDRVLPQDLDAFRRALEEYLSSPASTPRTPGSDRSTSATSPPRESKSAASRPLEVMFRTEGPDEPRHLRLRGQRLLDRTGEVHLVVRVLDVTDSAKDEAEMSRSRSQAEELIRLKSAFLSNVSHEIRTPLTTILGFAEILSDEVDEGSREFVQHIQEGGERLLDMLMSILDLARLESSSIDAAEGRFDVVEKVNEICRLMAPLAEEKGLFLDFVSADSPIGAVMDVFALERVVTSLVSNGIKFTEDGGLTVSIEADEDHVLVHVADTGIGIDEELIPLLFRNVRQDEEGCAGMYEGSGLGLAITKRLVQLMKGNIMAESEKGRGTVFTVALPRDGEPAVESPSDGISSDEEVRIRVLVVEDNADTRTLVNHLLRKNYDVVCATDADDALRLAAEQRFDVLLVDINLGKGRSGEDVLQAVKSLPTYEDTPVIAVTAYAMPGDRERFFSAGFDDYVSKPFSKQRLLEAVEGVLA